MHIYNKHDFFTTHHILDPDFQYHTILDEKIMYSFFKDLELPQDIKTLTGIYIKYHFYPLSYHLHPQNYIKLSEGILKTIKTYFDFGEANLYHDNDDTFFIVMFNIQEQDILNAIALFEKVIATKNITLKEHKSHLSFYYGIYFSHPFIHPFDFYHCTQSQYENTLKPHKSLISLMNTISDISFGHLTYKDNE